MVAFLLAGALTALAFVPSHLFPEGSKPIYILLGQGWLLKAILNRHQKSQACFWPGTLFGIGFFGIGVSWVYVSIHVHGHTSVFVAALLTALFIVMLACFTGACTFCFERWLRFIRPRRPATHAPSHPINVAYHWAFFWVNWEWIRSWLLMGFPWLYLGSYTVENHLAQFVLPIAGVYGSSLILSFIAALGVQWVIHRQWRLLSCGLLLLIPLFFKASLQPKQARSTDSTHHLAVRLIQPNLSPADKFTAEDPLHTLERHYIQHSLAPNELILWPEGAVILPFPQSEPLFERLNTQMKRNHSALILGAPWIMGPHQTFNSAVFLDGTHITPYFKQKLVPFGDFVPFETQLRHLLSFFNLPLSNFSEGQQEKISFQYQGYRLVPFICYEIAFPDYVRQSLHANRGDLIVNISEDGWFGQSFGPWQHFNLARLRALENGTPILRATTTGVSAIIGPRGEILHQLPPFKTAQHRFDVPVQIHSELTPWRRYGILPLFTVGWSLCLLIAWRRYRSKP